MPSGICFTVAELKSRLGITDTASDAILAGIADGVGAAIEAYLGFDPTAAELTEYYDTRGELELALNRWPVESVTSVHLDEGGFYGTTSGAFAGTTELEEGTGYAWAVTGGRRVGVLRRADGQRWPYRGVRAVGRLAPTIGVCPGCVKVTYTVDNANVLAAAKQAGLMECGAVYFSRAGTGTAMSESIDGASLSLAAAQRSQTDQTDTADGFISPFAAKLLRPFRLSRLV